MKLELKKETQKSREERNQPFPVEGKEKAKADKWKSSVAFGEGCTVACRPRQSLLCTGVMP